MTLENPTLADRRRNALVLQEIQPGLLGLMDGSVSTLAPIFAAAGLTGSLTAFAPPMSFLFALTLSRHFQQTPKAEKKDPKADPGSFRRTSEA
jgi:hypothetical protein